MKNLNRIAALWLSVLVLLLAGLLVSAKAWGQASSLVFEQTFTSSSANIQSITACVGAPTPDNGVMLVAGTNAIDGLPVPDGQGSGAMVIRLSATGEVVSSSKLKGDVAVQIYTSLYPVDMKAVVGGGYFVYGRYTGFTGVRGLFLLKLDEAGQTVWFADLYQIPLGSLNSFSPGFIRSLSDGGCLATYTDSYPRGTQYVGVKRVDAAGNVVFSASVDAIGASAIRGTNTVGGGCEFDGGYVLTGKSVTQNDSLPKGWIVRLDQTGEQQWLKNTGLTYYQDIIPSATGDGLVAVTNTYEIRLERLTPDGTRLNGNTIFASPRLGATENHQLRLDRDGRYLVSANVISAREGSDFAVFKAGFDGSSFSGIWSELISKGNDRLQSMAVLPNGNYLIAGTTTPNSSTTSSGYVRVFAKPTLQAAIYSVREGSWTDPAVWSTGQLPTMTDQVVLQHAVTVPAGTTGNLSRLTYTANGRLIFGDTSATIRAGF
nr:hypothetical protein [uncultured Arsenicibacter sp.]